MMEILKHPDARLRQVAKPVIAITDEIRTLIDDMVKTMYASKGCGLAATQVGSDHRIFVIDTEGEGNYKVFINPQIIEKKYVQNWEEGCLSLPDTLIKTKRALVVKVQALDQFGEAFELTARDLLSVAIQHELDHLDGVLMIDRKRPESAEELCKRLGFDEPSEEEKERNLRNNLDYFLRKR